MKIKSVVKVMNFHSLLRVNSSKKRAEELFFYEQELTNFVDAILNNKNLILDKKILRMNDKAKELNIYIANDLGFCGNFNSNVSSELKNDEDCDKIVIGKKIIGKRKSDDVILEITKEEYDKSTKRIEDILYKSIKNKLYSRVNLIYNHYYNISKIELVKKQLFPLNREELTVKEMKHKEDFVVEGNINDILVNIVTLYLSYEIGVATQNSYASENIQRQMITKKSLDKIDEIEEDRRIKENREKRIKDNMKLLDSIIKKDSVET